VPVIVIAFLIVLYTINIRVLQANQRLIVAMRACATGEDLKAEHFANALKLDQTAANQEIREQLYSCATNVIVSPLPLETKTEFYNLVEAEAAKHIEENPNDARAHLLVGGFYNSIGYWADAEKHLTRAVELSPGKQSMVFELAFNYLNNGKFNEALAILEDAYEASTDNTDARLAYIVGLISAGQEKKAQEIFGSQPELFEDERIINAYNVTKQYSRSIELYKRLLEKNPNQTSLYSGLASVYLMNNQRSLAIQTLNSAKAKFPELASQVDTLIKEIQEGRTF
jgi:tetratricopeptide (TPR) repeat protein